MNILVLTRCLMLQIIYSHGWSRAIRRRRGESQVTLAEKSRLTQGVISRAEDPDYGNLTLNTIGRIASGLDMAAVVKFIPFSELVKLTNEMSESEFAAIQTYVEEGAAGRGREEVKRLLLVFVLATVACAKAPEPHWVRTECRTVLATDDLVRRFKGARENVPTPPVGLISVRYGDTDTYGLFLASSPEAAEELLCNFDAWESHPPDVTYRSFGAYPQYQQRIVSCKRDKDGKCSAT